MSKRTPTPDEEKLADDLYSEGRKYDGQGDKSLANATLARAAFERAARLGHLKALRALADMEFLGSGGPKNMEHALWLKWRAYQSGDAEALEELVDLLESFSEASEDEFTKQRAENAARKAEEVPEHLGYIGSFIHGLNQEKLRKA